MASRSAIAPLSAADEAQVARALQHVTHSDGTYQTLVSAGRRKLSLHAIRPEHLDEEDWAGFSAAAGRRADASGTRLLPVVATGDFHGCAWIAYEVGSATPLAAERRRRWEVEPCLNLVADVAQTLDEAIQGGVLPWELQLGSIFVDSRFGALVSDLGTAREAFGNPETEAAAFVPPEVLHGEGAGERSGVFVCGVLLYQLLTGRPPRPGPLTRWRPDLPDSIDLVVARAMARDWLERYESATEFAERARRALTDSIEPAYEEDHEDDFEPEEEIRPEEEVQPEEEGQPEDELPPDDEDAFRLPPPTADEEELFRLAGDEHAEPEPESEPEPYTEPELELTDEDEAFMRAAVPVDPDDDEAFLQAAAPVDPDAPPPPALDYVGPVRGFGRPFKIAMVVAALGAGGFIGLTLAGSDEPVLEPVAHAGERALGITLPPGWSGGRAEDDVLLSAYPSSDGFSGLTVMLEKGTIPEEDKTDPVRLGELDTWREADRPRSVRYLAPTTEGTLVIACEATPSSAPNTLRLCERAASTLELGTIQGLSLPGVKEEPGFRAALARLRSARGSERRKLARARTAEGQATVTLALAAAYERAAASLAKLPDGEPIADAARDAARAYHDLAAAARKNSKSGWTAGRESVLSAEAAVAEAIEARG